MMNKPAAIYARVSSDRQKENHTIASQTAALIEYAEANGYTVPAEWVFQDEGYSGANLVRPGLEALRDLGSRRRNPCGARVFAGPVEPQVCVSGLAD
jgi:DNA invertase Pin-like site-specific DNA recombinase